MLDGRRAVIFGGNGFIGRYLVARLARAGVRLIVAGRRASEARHLLPMGDAGQIVLADLSIRDGAAVQAAIAGADFVVNLVGILYESGRQQFEALQHQAAGQIARLAAEAGVARLIHISAIGADAASPSLYARSKGEGEAAVRAAFPAATILRPSVVFGAEDQFLNRFAEMAARFGILPVIGGGATRFQPLYVGDVAVAVVTALARPDTAGRTYELGGPETVSFLDLMARVRRAIARPALLVPIPWGVAEFQAFFSEYLPSPPLTRDQLILLRRDNVVTADGLGCAALGIEPMALDAVLPGMLARYRLQGP